MWSSGWTELRDAQERAIPLILAAEQDVIIAASTASGKTEAAFFPILTRLIENRETPGLVMYISPLKALINDQWQRLEQLAEILEVPVTPWHGDIFGGKKARFLKRPSGCLLITPESIEALLMHQGSGLAGLLAGLKYMVIDEMHSFMGSERGKQLQSQLHRIECVLERRVCRIGLSATLGEMKGAQQFLRPEAPETVALVVTKEGGQELQVLVRGVVEKAGPPKSKALPVEPAPPPAPANLDPEEEGDDPAIVARTVIVTDLFNCLRGSNNLVFPNARTEVEFYADRLRRRCEFARLPNEFWPHHGNLSKEIREETEAALKQKVRPATAVCTSTLELGIDIGSVKSVAQIQPPPSVASLRQRLGRSGRRKDEPAILRGYVIERQLTPSSALSDQLRQGLLQMIAMIRLLVAGWYEPGSSGSLHASTLVQQILSVLVQYGGMHPRTLWELLCHQSAFAAVPQTSFLALLSELGAKEIIFQDSTGLLLLAPKGEKITEYYGFYAAFASAEEYRIVAFGRPLGSLPVDRPLMPGAFVVFGGRRWQVLDVSAEDKVIEVKPGPAGTLPSFSGTTGASIHDRVREEMRAVLRETDPVPFLDQTAAKLLVEARTAYLDLNLEKVWIRQSGKETQVLTWKGDKVNQTLLLLLQARDFKGHNDGVYLSLNDTDPAAVGAALREIAVLPSISPEQLAETVLIKTEQKWDQLLPASLLNATYASANLDLPGAQLTAAAMLSRAAG